MSNLSSFSRRHIGPNAEDTTAMLKTVGVQTIEELIAKTVPAIIRSKKPLEINEAITEFEYLKELKTKASKNKVFKNFIGQGYYGTITPSVILRNIFENPGWYTQYTPYQAEIAQGRLESLLNYQTMVTDLTGLPIANASLLDEATAAAEAMAMFFNHKNKNEQITAPKFFVDKNCYSQTIEVVKTRARPLEIEVVIADFKNIELDETYFGALIQYPNALGTIENYEAFINQAHSVNVLVAMATDLLALTLLKSPSDFNADVALGTAQRFGVPMGFGGPHAAFFATKDEFKRVIPGRIIGVSIDSKGNRALRMALQTREQHIRREKATSNICTAQALLANMAAMYAVYHGANGLKNIANIINQHTHALYTTLTNEGFIIKNKTFFDTITIEVKNIEAIKQKAISQEFNFNYFEDSISISIDETTTNIDIFNIVKIFTDNNSKTIGYQTNNLINKEFVRTSPYLLHPVFNSYHSESQMMRYIKSLENKDLSLNTSMISLGSCTMKLNAATELIPVSWPEFNNIHPFAPSNQWLGYQEIIEELEKGLNEITGFTATSLQPNSGAQGEYTGLLTIRAYHEYFNNSHRNIILIPISAHGTNPASAVMAGMKVVVTKCDTEGNIDLDDLKLNIEKYKDNLAGLMVTYPSTHGVFEASIKEICTLIHDNGGLVYMDGANMNAQVGLTSPGLIGADVCHLNLHKTFAIPHGGGGPGVGPICVNDKLKPFLPKHNIHPQIAKDGEKAITAVSGAPYGSASILLISYAYIKMLGGAGLQSATEYAILNANYMKAKLESNYKILYTGNSGTCAHEFIVDLRPFKQSCGVEAEDVAKRLMDYGFHAPTMSFPVTGTIMIEPTESEDKAELDRFCDALNNIYFEIKAIEDGKADKLNNVLKNAPHTQADLCSDTWEFPYSRKEAGFPLDYVAKNKFWPTVNRVNNTHGDRNLICSCEPIESFMNA